jgi:hypothetical protein
VTPLRFSALALVLVACGSPFAADPERLDQSPPTETGTKGETGAREGRDAGDPPAEAMTDPVTPDSDVDAGISADSGAADVMPDVFADRAPSLDASLPEAGPEGGAGPEAGPEAAAPVDAALHGDSSTSVADAAAAPVPCAGVPDHTYCTVILLADSPAPIPGLCIAGSCAIGQCGYPTNGVQNTPGDPCATVLYDAGAGIGVGGTCQVFGGATFCAPCGGSNQPGCPMLPQCAGGLFLDSSGVCIGI